MLYLDRVSEPPTIDTEGPVPVYVQVADDIAARIDSGELVRRQADWSLSATWRPGTAWPMTRSGALLRYCASAG